jgi:hypothetical protein
MPHRQVLPAVFGLGIIGVIALSWHLLRDPSPVALPPGGSRFSGEASTNKTRRLPTSEATTADRAPAQAESVDSELETRVVQLKAVERSAKEKLDRLIEARKNAQRVMRAKVGDLQPSMAMRGIAEGFDDPLQRRIVEEYSKVPAIFNEFKQLLARSYTSLGVENKLADALNSEDLLRQTREAQAELEPRIAARISELGLDDQMTAAAQDFASAHFWSDFLHQSLQAKRRVAGLK